MRVNLTIPVLNEERRLRHSIELLVGFLSSSLTVPWQVVIADNGSTDATRAVGHELERQLRR